MSSPLVSDCNGRPTRNASRSKVPSPTGATHGRHSRRQPSRSTNSNGRSTITAGAAAHDGDTAASRWAVRGGQQRTGTPAQDRVSSAEVRRRLRALQYGDIEVSIAFALLRTSHSRQDNGSSHDNYRKI